MKKILITAALCFIFTFCFSQLNWQKGGNNGTPGEQPPSIGTDATWNAPLQFITVGTERMRLTETGF